MPPHWRLHDCGISVSLEQLVTRRLCHVVGGDGHVPLSGGVSRRRAGQFSDYAAASSGMGVTSSAGVVLTASIVASSSMDASEK